MRPPALARPQPREAPIGRSSELAELGHRTVPILYRGRPESAILVRFGGIVYAYLNRCVHMPRTLDGETGRIFDDSGRQLRCSMHGNAYQPETGLCLSEICAGQSLTPVRMAECDGTLHLTDKRARLAGAQLGPEDRG